MQQVLCVPKILPCFVGGSMDKQQIYNDAKVFAVITHTF